MGGDQTSGEKQNPDSGFWYDAIVARSGWGRSMLEESAKIGRKFDAQAADLLWGTMVADNQRELVVLIDYSPEIQRSIANEIVAGNAKTVAQAASIVWNEPIAERLIFEPEKQVKKVYSAFEKMTDDAKEIFYKAT